MRLYPRLQQAFYACQTWPGKEVFLLRLVRLLEDGIERWGAVTEETGCRPDSDWTIRVYARDPFGDDFAPTERVVASSQVKLLAPCRATKIVAVGINYADHAREMGHELPRNPIIFIKPPTTLVGAGDAIVLPAQSQQVDYEAELAAVVKKPMKNVPPKEVRRHLLGFTCLNDVTARDLQRADGQWTRAKSFDTFCPMGPCVTDEVDPNRAAVELYLNGERRQSSSTENFIFSIEALVSFISEIMTLLPGDVVTTGTPSGVGPMKAGDVVEVRVAGIGRLVNHVR